MNVALLKDMTVREQIREHWKRWQRNKIWYDNVVDWWVKAVKQQVRKLFGRLGAEKRRDERDLENFYFQCIYAIIQNPQTRLTEMAEVNKYKAKIVNIYSRRMEGAKREADGNEI